MFPQPGEITFSGQWGTTQPYVKSLQVTFSTPPPENAEVWVTVSRRWNSNWCRLSLWIVYKRNMLFYMAFPIRKSECTSDTADLKLSTTLSFYQYSQPMKQSPCHRNSCSRQLLTDLFKTSMKFGFKSPSKPILSNISPWQLRFPALGWEIYGDFRGGAWWVWSSGWRRTSLGCNTIKSNF